MGFLGASTIALRRFRAPRGSNDLEGKKRQRFVKLIRCGSCAAVEQPVASHCLSTLSAGGPLLPAGYASMDIARLEEQAEKLRLTVARRQKHPDACGDKAKSDSIIAHYERLIDGLEQQIEQLLRLQVCGA
mmetsp:Transcript_57907/g.167857  ORF Transcript_57907/g.167857 Transcript_57907/m.167857 type:complete len:131 (-) Transcript_57907:174-566(-)|eukprot:CAMPEP_0170266170 /NCGR_PEP_ID=MMETSP0116_2-20130129/32998_1 /TAXON_ID=400756 /ORGANISM="Durinskia baltica, Strain CSIRO CS-38" /LENGTH=130 /DNA_ID=CAMNT_0010517299 /DNA_START=56 /DNA_END=448 /DNA_ORIENTATION=-